MKKLILSAAIVLGSLSMQAATEMPVNVTASSIVQDEFVEVGADALPSAVKSTIEKSFPNTKLEKAFVNTKKEYKLELSSGEKKFTVYTDEAGNIVKK